MDAITEVAHTGWDGNFDTRGQNKNTDLFLVIKNKSVPFFVYSDPKYRELVYLCDLCVLSPFWLTASYRLAREELLLRDV